MAAEYYVRIKGKTHGPFSGSQLKKLADKGQVTEDAEVRKGEDGEWYPADRVAGLFDDAPRKSTKKKASTGKKASKSRKKPKRKSAVDADDVFDLDDDDDDIELDDEDDLEFEDDDEDFEDSLFDDEDDDFDDDDRPRRRRKPRRKRKTGTSWGQVRVGLLLLGIAVCLYTTAFGMSALRYLIGGLVQAAGSFPGESTSNLLDLLSKGGVLFALLANLTAIVGGAMSIFAPGRNGAKGMAIAVLATLSVHFITHFIYVFQPRFESRGNVRITTGGGGIRISSGGFGGNFGGNLNAADIARMQQRAARAAMAAMGGEYAYYSSNNMEYEVRFVLTWLPYFAGLILLCIYLWSMAQIKKDYHHGESCIGNIWLIGIYMGMGFLGYLIGKLDLMPNVTSQSGAQAMFWLRFLIRSGQLTLLGIFLGRLIGQTFYTKGSV